MSWDCIMTIDTGGESPVTVCDVRNVTYNNGKIFEALGVHPDHLHGRTGAEADPAVSKALADSHVGEAELARLEPANGWGGLGDSREFLAVLLAACRAHPKATVR